MHIDPDENGFCSPFHELWFACIADGMVHLRLVCDLYARQHARGKILLHEHPTTAGSWKQRCVRKILKKAGVHKVNCDQCTYGLTTTSTRAKDSAHLPAKKPTSLMTNSVAMARRLNRRCDGQHIHQPLEGGRAADAENYPDSLIQSILQGIADTRDNIQCINSIAEHDWNVVLKIAEPTPTNDEPNHKLHCNPPTPTDSSIPLTDGGKRKVTYEVSQFKATYLDEYTRELLPSHLVRSAIIKELNYFNGKVWEATTQQQALATPDSKLIRSRWVISNKGDSNSYDIRARLVACEINQYRTDEFYASTPPLAAKRLLLSGSASKRFDSKNVPLEISFVDIRKAYFNAVPRRSIHLTFPKEMGMPTHMVAKLKRCVYGTRDAGQLWEDCYAQKLIDMGFIRGLSSPCCFFITHSAASG